MGKWVLCHTSQGTYHGIMNSCDTRHVILHVPRHRNISLFEGETAEINHTFGATQTEWTSVYYGGFGGYGGFGRVAVPLAAIAGITLIGASALWW